MSKGSNLESGQKPSPNDNTSIASGVRGCEDRLTTLLGTKHFFSGPFVLENVPV